ncbi:MAG: TIGR04222 domain-containing membrane protein, partial [Planctomycetales bacterium]|nr:TIGR04222 domain-containing membrane protein [Planctomycetales bacterium]
MDGNSARATLAGTAFASPNRWIVWAASMLPLVAITLNPFDMPGPMFLVFYAVLYLCALVGGLAIRGMTASESPNPRKGGLSAYEVACLAHDERVAVSAAICRLTHDGLLKIVSQEKKLLGITTSATHRFAADASLPKDAEPIEAAIYRRAEEAGESGVAFAELQSAGRPEAADLVARLRKDGLLRDDD